jgi:hypothetical protein
MSDFVTALNAASAGDVHLSKQIERLMYIWWYENRKNDPHVHWKFTDKQNNLYFEYTQMIKDRITTWGLE